MRKKDGFTLIELLAVIVILAIIALIAVPQVMKILNQARKSAAEDSTYGVYNATQDYISRLMLSNGGDFPSGELTFTCDNTSCKLDNYATLVSEGYNLEETLDYKGKKATGGKITVSNNGNDIVIEDLKVNEFLCNYSGEKATCEKDIPLVTKSFAEDDWSTIAKAVKKGQIDNYHVGDTKTIEMDVDGDGTKETYTLRIVNTSTPRWCSSDGFSQTACGFVIEFFDIVSLHRMNPGNYNQVNSNGFNNIGGWKYSEMRAFLNGGKYLQGQPGEIDYSTNGIYNLLPSDLKNVIADTFVVSGHGNMESENFITVDKLYLLSRIEVGRGHIVGSGVIYDSASGSTSVLDYYRSSNNNAIKKYNGSNEYWWLRNAGYGNNTSGYADFSRIDKRGNDSSAYCFNTSGVAPAFRIG